MQVAKVISSMAMIVGLSGCDGGLVGRQRDDRRSDGGARVAIAFEGMQEKAIWLRPDTLLWPVSAGGESSWSLIEQADDGMQRATKLTAAGSFDASDPDFGRYPYYSGYVRLKSEALAGRVAEVLKGGRFAVVGKKADGSSEPFGVQEFPVLDALFAYEGVLGPSFADGTPRLALWAPTARAVRVAIYDGETLRGTVPMEAGPKGIWSVSGDASWRDAYYLYEVDVYVPATGRVETNRVTDPYSVSLARNSERSQLVDLEDAALKPAQWDGMQKPALARAEDITLYELHVRDFSKDGFRAFTERESAGMRHLRGLAEAGLTHVHLLPIFDFATVNEDKTAWRAPMLPPAEARQPEDLQAAITAVKDQDGYNWGYDPLHYNVPEGSYASEAEGSARILEMREMVKGLADVGLRVVMDVVFNHTSNAGQGEQSVLDRVVPGYYYRLDKDGKVQTSTCCPDTASERAMMQKLMVDSVVHWAKRYKIDGFRFDLMGHHTKGNLVAVRKALDALSLAKDGVDGSAIYLYGEGWKFGSLDAILPQETCTQLNVGGLGIGTFNDRLRDRARGGNFQRENLANQGFVTGLSHDANGLTGLGMVPDGAEAQEALLVEYQDVVKLGLAGNLRDFGPPLQYGDVPAGYALAPRETINYVSAHDNFTLWDHIAAKAPFRTEGRTPATASLADRVAMQQIAIAIVALGQGIPFFDAGIEMLRSKSGDDNSYDSGDAFNALDFTLGTHAFGIGLPSLASNGEAALEFWRPRLADESLKATPEAMAATVEFFKAMLRIRKSSPAFRLGTAAEVRERMSFLDAENAPYPGVIVMRIDADGIDPERKALIVAFNVRRDPVEIASAKLRDETLTLVHGAGATIESAHGLLRLPGRSVAVFEAR